MKNNNLYNVMNKFYSYVVLLIKLPFKLFYPITKNKIIFYLLVSIGLFGYYHNQTIYNRGKEVLENIPTTVKVVKGNINNSINSFGKANLLYEQKLNFSETGRVTRVLVNQGQLVNKGDTLVELDNSVMMGEISRAQINLDNAIISLNKLKNDKKNYDNVKLKSDIEILKLRIKEAQNDFDKLESILGNEKNLKLQELEQLKTKLSDSINLQPLNISKIQKELNDMEDSLRRNKEKLHDLEKYLESDLDKLLKDKENKILSYNQNLQTSYMSILNMISSVDSTLEPINDVLGVDLTNNSNSRNIYFSARNSTFANQAQIAYSKVKGGRLILEKELDKIKIEEVTTSDLQKLFSFQAEIYDSLVDLGDSMFHGYSNSVEASNFSKGEIESGKSSMLGLKNSSFSSYNQAIKDSLTIVDIENIQDIERKYRDDVKAKHDEIKDLKDTIKTQEKDFLIAKTNIDYRLQDIDGSIDSQKLAIQNLEIELSKIDIQHRITYENKKIELEGLKLDLRKLEERFNSSEDDDIIFAENKVKDARLDLEQKTKQLENFKIIAPFDGRVTTLDFKQGDNIDQNSTKSLYLVNPNLIEITINLDQVDIVKVRGGQEAIIRFDAFPGIEYKGVLGDVTGMMSDPNSRNYPVKVTFTKGEEDIFSGMSASVSINLENREDVLVIPLSGIETDLETGEKFVMVDNKGQKEKRIIETGISGDGIIEVISGLEEGEIIYEVNFDANNFKVDDFFGGGGMYGMY